MREEVQWANPGKCLELRAERKGSDLDRPTLKIQKIVQTEGRIEIFG